MNPERLTLLLDNYAATFPEDGVPDRLRALWQTAEQCVSAFDSAAEDFSAMLHSAFDGGAAVINSATSVQPLHGLYCLAEKAPRELRQAFGFLLASDRGDLNLRQAQMQAFCERCNLLLALHAPGKRSWALNLRAAISLLALLRPADNYLYKTTEARYLADMTGYPADVSSGATFSLAAFYGMGDALSRAIAAHPALSSRIPDRSALPAEALRSLMAGDMLLNAGAKKLALFGDAAPLIQGRGRAGQAAHERAMQISVLQAELDEKQLRLDALRQELADLPAPDLVGQRFRSAVFGEVIAVAAQDSVLTVEAAGVTRCLSYPACFLNGHLTPLDEALAAHYTAQRQLMQRERSMNADVVNLQCAIRRLHAKP